MQGLEVRPYSPESPYSSQPVLWSQPIAAASQHTTYTGKALQPGQSYDWELVIDPDFDSNLRFTFQVMKQEKRNLIAAELQALDVQLKSAGAAPEEIALQRADYFAERNLWSDALQEIYSVKSPSTALTSTADEITVYLCNS